MDIPINLIHQYTHEAHKVLGIPEPDDWEDPMYEDDPHEWYSTKEERYQKQVNLSQQYWENYNELYLELEKILDTKKDYYAIICECFQLDDDTIQEVKNIQDILGEYKDVDIDTDEWDDDIEQYYMAKKLNFEEYFIKAKTLLALAKRDELIAEIHSIKRRILTCWFVIKQNQILKDRTILAMKNYAEAIRVDHKLEDLYKLCVENRQVSPFNETPIQTTSRTTTKVVLTPVPLHIHQPTLNTERVTWEVTNGIKSYQLRLHIKHNVNYFNLYHDGLIFDRGKYYNDKLVLLKEQLQTISTQDGLCRIHGIKFIMLFMVGLAFDRGKDHIPLHNNYCTSVMEVSSHYIIQVTLRSSRNMTLMYDPDEKDSKQLHPLHKVSIISRFATKFGASLSGFKSYGVYAAYGGINYGIHWQYNP